MQKTITIGTYNVHRNAQNVPVICTVTLENGNLSIVGDIKNFCGGQIDSTLREGLENGDFNPAGAWVKTFLDIWDKWHLNNMRAGCEHQRAEGWDQKPIDPSKPLNAYGKFFDGQQTDSWNMWSWIPESENPNGLLSKPCPVCGYKYGTAWKKEELPQDVVKFIENL